MKVNCSYCGNEVEKHTGHVNRARKNGNNIYCNKVCSGLGRRHGKTKQQLKEEKRLYDQKYREKNLEKLKKRKKKYYQENYDKIYSKQRAKRNNDESRANHAEYCRQPEQRHKEKIRRYIRVYGEDWETQTKHCISCDEEKHIFEFDSFLCFPDGRRHICNDCEKYQVQELNYSTRGVLQAMQSQRQFDLTRWDYAKYPYLIEAFKYKVLLNKLTK